MPNLLIIRGIPGSGKSTLAKSLLNNDKDNCSLVSPNYQGIIYTHHYEADMFFIDPYGKYNFNKSLLKFAHDWCFNNTVKSLLDYHNTIVSNTFIKLWELEKYISLATIIPDLSVEVVELNTKYQSIHNVPEDTINKMKTNFEPYIKS